MTLLDKALAWLRYGRDRARPLAYRWFYCPGRGHWVKFGSHGRCINCGKKVPEEKPPHVLDEGIHLNFIRTVKTFCPHGVAFLDKCEIADCPTNVVSNG